MQVTFWQPWAELGRVAIGLVIAGLLGAAVALGALSALAWLEDDRSVSVFLGILTLCQLVAIVLIAAKA